MLINSEALPRRIILSRKGSDATWGGRPSLRVGRELISLPIPESLSRAQAAERTGLGVRYRDLPPHPRIGALQAHLKAIDPDRHVHLDPDLRPALRPAAARRGKHAAERLFGQEGAAERHLRNQKVGPGDLFLFFGWFREAVPHAVGWKRVGPDLHCLWGWLQIAETHAVASAEAAAHLPWAAHHPHVAHWERYDRHNRLYRARRRLSFAPDLPGAGVFRWHPALTLTARCRPASHAPATRSAWCLPDFLRRTGLTYNQIDGPACSAAAEAAGSRVHLHSAPIGQEFVMPAHRPFRPGEWNAVATWLQELFRGVDHT